MERRATISLYWKCQVIGWSVAALYWGYEGYLNGGFNFRLGIVKFLFDVTIYILITHLYRNFSLRHRWQDLILPDLLKRIVPAAIFLGLTYTIVTSLDVYFFWVLFKKEYRESFITFFRINALTIFIAGMRLMSIWLLAYHLYHYAQREIRSTRENARLSLVAKDAQLNNLVAQLNPHFLFNSLNNIKALVAENPSLARRAIDLLSELLRTSLARQSATEGSSSATDSGLVAIRDELSMVNDYLELEKMRFEERLQVDVNVAPELLSTMIIPFSIQLLVENGIKHGIDNLKRGGLIAIKIESVGGFVKIQVSNPGKLDVSGSSDGLGLKNLQERLKLVYGNAASFDIKRQGETVLATILIPIL